VNLAGAFEEAVDADGAMRKSTERLASYADGMYTVYRAPQESYVMAFGNVSETFEGLGEKHNMDGLYATLSECVADRLTQEH
jgi:hypothetical protein